MTWSPIPSLGKRVVGSPPNTRAAVRLVVAEQQVRLRGGVQVEVAEQVILGPDDRVRRVDPGDPRLRLAVAPGPGVAEPQRRQHLQHGRLGRAVVHGDAAEDVLRGRLRVLHLDVEVVPGVEDTGVDQLVLELLARPFPVDRDQVVVGKLGLRVLVQVALVAVGRDVVDVEVVLLDVLAVVALGVGQAEQPLLEDRVPLVPQRQRQAQPLLVVADPGQAVLAPPVGPRARLIVGEVGPGVSAVAVVLADRPPLALAQVRSPGAPRRPRPSLPQPQVLGPRRAGSG